MEIKHREALANRNKAKSKEVSSSAIAKFYYKQRAKGGPSLSSHDVRFDIVYSSWKESYFI
jgi:hypothetical protein